jgi:hypothetical protein
VSQPWFVIHYLSLIAQHVVLRSLDRVEDSRKGSRGEASPNSVFRVCWFKSSAGEAERRPPGRDWSMNHRDRYIVTEFGNRRYSANDVSTSHDGDATIRSFTDHRIVSYRIRCPDRSAFGQLWRKNRFRRTRTEIVENEQPDRRRQVALLAFAVDLADKFRERLVPL